MMPAIHSLVAIGFDELLGSPWVFLNFIFGGIPTWLASIVGEQSAAIVIILTFFLLFSACSDVIKAFSGLGPLGTRIAGLVIASVIANLGGIEVLIEWLVTPFSWLGGYAIVGALGEALVACVILGWGSRKTGQFIKGHQRYTQNAIPRNQPGN